MAEEHQCVARKWYFSRQEIEEHSPSRKDGVDLDTESCLRKLYCSFLQELGMELKVPQVTIATAVMFCHRFYMRQSLAKNDWQTIAVVSMFLACKAEETPRWLSDVIVMAYKLMFKWDPSAPRRIKQKEVYDRQKNLILTGERILLVTIAYDMNIEHPYKPLVAALKNLDISNKELARVAWNFVNDWLRTTLCLQYKPHYIAAGSMFLAARFQRVKLPTQKGKTWWMQFDVSPKLLEGVIQEMLGLLEKNHNEAPQPMSGRVIESKPAIDSTASDSPISSCIINGSATDQLTGNGDKVDAGGLAKLAISNVGVNKVPPSVQPSVPDRSCCQASNSGSTNSAVEDDNGEPKEVESDQNPSCKIVSSQSGSWQLDVHRIREALKRRRCERAEKRKSAESINHQVDSEAWIERELENGIEPEKRMRL